MRRIPALFVDIALKGDDQARGNKGNDDGGVVTLIIDDWRGDGGEVSGGSDDDIGG
ncbi:hypothetical protein M8C21_002295 [Ambrosia artemisiifolia]|uniref:Uncharacterized protein n=1 Tax=Ambrosia artemisiifolia TaxID=4212 RepID=A0AAD5CT39_AMBAR|nr:hypothetical protein M8C21_002295 [Ambrosia artemisiifolia]